MASAWIVVHGVVQGVGYRRLVAEQARRFKLTGMVRNAENGSVEILACGNAVSIRGFIKSIDVKIKYGPDVMSIEVSRGRKAADTAAAGRYNSFVIEG